MRRAERSRKNDGLIGRSRRNDGLIGREQKSNDSSGCSRKNDGLIGRSRKNNTSIGRAQKSNGQNSNRPIGIFDSGLGGLTVMASVMKLLPSEDIIYFGDTAHVPYGSKSRPAVTGFSLAIASFLRDRNVKMIVVACNTASAYALAALKKTLDIPVIGVIEPGARAALRATRSGRIGVIGTQGTIRSASYPAAIARLAPDAAVFPRPCPLFVPLVEEGWLDHPVTREVAREYLRPLAEQGIDTLVLGCTHYPLIKEVIGKAAGDNVTLIDSADATAREVQETIQKNGLAERRRRAGRYRFYVSDIPQKFQEIGQLFLGRRMHPVTRVDLDRKAGEKR